MIFDYLYCEINTNTNNICYFYIKIKILVIFFNSILNESFLYNKEIPITTLQHNIVTILVVN